jgi:lipopolysaccharide transport system permease protein
MYGTPIIYPYSKIPEEYQKMMFFNPISHVVEGFRFIFLGKGVITADGILYSIGIAVLVLFFGVLIFNKTERSFIDTV